MSINVSRRAFLAATAAGLVRGEGKEKLRAGLIGCGGRGTQAAVNLLSGDPGVELAAMADIFPDKLDGSLARLQDPKYLGWNVNPVAEFTGQRAEELMSSVMARAKVDPEHRFVGFDGYKKLIASDVDIVMLCTPPGYRPEHFEAAVAAKKHIFTEKPIATDAVGARRFLAAVEKAQEQKLTVVAGAQRHADRAYIETVQKVKDGAVGEILALYSYFLSGPVMHAQARDPKWADMEWQHRNWYSFIWICGDQIVEQHYHNIDFMNWVMGAHPVSVVASGGAAWRPRKELYGNIYDHLGSDFVYPNGVRLSSYCRQYEKGTFQKVSDLIVGTKGRSNGQDLGAVGLNSQVQEHINLLKSIRGDGPYRNEGRHVAESTLTCLMARESGYSGLEVTWDMIMKSQQDLQPKAFGYKLPMEVPPLPAPGKYKFV